MLIAWCRRQWDSPGDQSSPPFSPVGAIWDRIFGVFRDAMWDRIWG